MKRSMVRRSAAPAKRSVKKSRTRGKVKVVKVSLVQEAPLKGVCLLCGNDTFPVDERGVCIRCASDGEGG